MNIDLTPWQNKKICVAVSGGGDSMALLHYLLSHAHQYNITLSVVNCEHGIRGESSLADSSFVVNFCARNGLPVFTFSADCPKIAATQKVSLETAARNFRYDCFDKLLAEGKVEYIAVAHHMDDNAETVLFRLCRGASLTGVSGIHSREQDGIIRPFLGVNKSQIDVYLQENNIPYRHDETNDDDKITRNAIRRKVLPELEKAVPSAIEGIVRFASLAGEDDEYLYALAQELIVLKKDVYTVKYSEIKPLFRRACLMVMKLLGIEKDYTTAHLNDLYALQSLQNGDRISLPKGITAVKEYVGIAFYEREKERLQEFTEEIPFQYGTVKIGDRTVMVSKSGELTGNGQVLRFSEKKIPDGAVFRTRREGDVFTKFGGGTKKLKEYLIDKKIPMRERNKLILLAYGEQVLAIAGVEISNKIKVDDGEEATYLYSEGDK